MRNQLTASVFEVEQDSLRPGLQSRLSMNSQLRLSYMGSFCGYHRFCFSEDFLFGFFIFFGPRNTLAGRGHPKVVFQRWHSYTWWTPTYTKTCVVFGSHRKTWIIGYRYKNPRICFTFCVQSCDRLVSHRAFSLVAIHLIRYCAHSIGWQHKYIVLAE